MGRPHRPRKRLLHRRGLLAAAAGLLAAAGLWAGANGKANSWAFAATTISVPLWADFRTGRQPRNSNKFVFTTTVVRNITEAIVELETSMFAKLAENGMRSSLPGPVVEAVLVDEDVGSSALLEAKEQGIAVYFARQKHEGVGLENNAFFVYDVENQEPIAALDPPHARLTQMQRPLPLDVWQMVVDKEKARQEAEEMERYRAGLRGDSPYIQPPRRRQRELFGFHDLISVTRGRTLAKTIPLDPTLWAQALMLRNKVAQRRAAESEVQTAVSSDSPDKFSSL